MANDSPRTFEDKPATRERVPIMVGLVGPSGSGKTYSALRLATGIQRVNGGDIYMIDTEARRGLHYAEKFAFRHVVFGAPFSPLDYLDAIQHCVKKGAGVVIVDSMSHEHEGPGGVLEMHDEEVTRLAAAWKTSRDAVNFPAWGEPKKARRRMINTILQMPCSFVFCFRAKPKSKPGKDENGRKTLIELGWMPIAGEEFIYEMTLNCLLEPGSGGVPTWDPGKDAPGSKEIIKLPEQFRSLFSKSVPLSEDIGEALAKWAAGSGAVFRGQGEHKGKPLSTVPADVLGRYRAAIAAQPKLAGHLAEVDAEMAARVAADANQAADDDAPPVSDEDNPGEVAAQ